MCVKVMAGKGVGCVRGSAVQYLKDKFRKTEPGEGEGEDSKRNKQNWLKRLQNKH